MAAGISVAGRARDGRRQERITPGELRGQHFAGWVNDEATDAEGSDQE
jgi:hypothetical protein